MTILASLPALASVAAAQNDLLSRIFVFDRYGELLQMLQNSIFAGAVLGLIGEGSKNGHRVVPPGMCRVRCGSERPDFRWEP